MMAFRLRRRARAVEVRPVERVAGDVETLRSMRRAYILAAVLGVVSLPMVILYLLLVLSSFADRIVTGPDVLEARYSIENWLLFLEGRVAPAAGKLYTPTDILMTIVNTAIVALGVTAVVVFTSVLAGYAFSRMRFRWRRELMTFIILLHAFPGVALIIAVYAIYVWSSMPLAQQGGLMIAYAFAYTVLARASLELPMSIWLMKGFFDKIPWEVEWSALIDGASRLRTWWKIILPQVKPGIAALAIFAFLAGWEDLIYVHVFLYIGTAGEVKTLATLIEELTADLETAYLPIVAAAGTLYLIPTILFFVLTQKLLLEAYSGGLKA
jgi:inositol-phosphate transport system permease protein